MFPKIYPAIHRHDPYFDIAHVRRHIPNLIQTTDLFQSGFDIRDPRKWGATRVAKKFKIY